MAKIDARKFLVILPLISICNQLSVVEGDVQDMNDVISEYMLEVRGDFLYLTWELSNPTGDIVGYRVDSQNSTLLTNSPFNIGDVHSFSCCSPILVTISSYNSRTSTFEKNTSASFTWEDIVNVVDTTLVTTMIDVSWVMICRTNAVRKFLVTWRNEKENDTATCWFTVKSSEHFFNTNNCLKVKLLPCTNYNVTIQPRNMKFEDIGVPAKKFNDASTDCPREPTFSESVTPTFITKSTDGTRNEEATLPAHETSTSEQSAAQLKIIVVCLAVLSIILIITLIQFVVMPWIRKHRGITRSQTTTLNLTQHELQPLGAENL